MSLLFLKGSSTTLHSPSGLYLGMWGRFWRDATVTSDGSTPRDPLGTGTSYTGDSSLTALAQYESDAGHHCAIVAAWRNFSPLAGDTGWWGSRAANTGAWPWLGAVGAHGSIPFVTWSPAGGSMSGNFLADVIAGNHDTYLQGVAADLAAWGQPIMIRMMHEFNGTWESHWGIGNTDGGTLITTELYRQAWIHIVTVCRGQGATNIQWVYCPNIWTSSSPTRLNWATPYPGPSYVDWLGLDGYNVNDSTTVWQSFSDLFSYPYSQIAANNAFSGMPIIVCETGCSPSLVAGKTKAAWVADTYNPASATGVFAFPRIRAMLWFNEDKRHAEGLGTTNRQFRAEHLQYDESDLSGATPDGSGVGLSAATELASAVAGNPASFNQFWP